MGAQATRTFESLDCFVGTRMPYLRKIRGVSRISSSAHVRGDDRGDIGEADGSDAGGVDRGDAGGAERDGVRGVDLVEGSGGVGSTIGRAKL